MTGTTQATIDRERLKQESREVFKKYIHPGTIIRGHAPMPFESCHKHRIEKLVTERLNSIAEKLNSELKNCCKKRRPLEKYTFSCLNDLEIEATSEITTTKSRPLFVAKIDAESITAICLFVFPVKVVYTVVLIFWKSGYFFEVPQKSQSSRTEDRVVLPS